jgi:hypothetical protein
MLELWFLGFVSFILFRAFYAGMNSKTLFYRDPRGYESAGIKFCEYRFFGYLLRSFVGAVTWPVSLPILGVYELGKRFNKEA